MMTDAAQDAEACRRLWLSVACLAAADAAKAVVNRDKQKPPLSLEAAVNIEMRYFTGASWRKVCELAGITHRPEAIRDMLMSDKAKDSAALMRRAYGLSEDVM